MKAKAKLLLLVILPTFLLLGACGENQVSSESSQYCLGDQTFVFDSVDTLAETIKGIDNEADGYLSSANQQLVWDDIATNDAYANQMTYSSRSFTNYGSLSSDAVTESSSESALIASVSPNGQDSYYAVKKSLARYDGKLIIGGSASYKKVFSDQSNGDAVAQKSKSAQVFVTRTGYCELKDKIDESYTFSSSSLDYKIEKSYSPSSFASALSLCFGVSYQAAFADLVENLNVTGSSSAAVTMKKYDGDADKDLRVAIDDNRVIGTSSVNVSMSLLIKNGLITSFGYTKADFSGIQLIGEESYAYEFSHSDDLVFSGTVADASQYSLSSGEIGL